ncbi:hypothetical protein EPR50_G00081890 [Perca flavescens]|uniref:Reverse transcriptase domain-containing protein n=1 Tax=Perca flavescens TaxID=8167 RepID=A0A484D6L2_PERFV|nr:hypothetical protein EPR50_G00081890 [Perca flavescens]
MRARLGGLLLPGSLSVECPLVVSAYADDVNIFVCSQTDVQCLQDALSLYERATSARVNWAKSEALLVGQWRGKAVPSLPGGLEWGKEGLKVLGVFLGSEGFVKKNWEGVKEKVCARLSKWTWLLPQLSNRGRVLVANNLVASTLWHKLIAIVPPRGLMEDIQRTIVDFFWSGRHWVRAAVLYLPVAEGGQGLVDIQSKIASFRLQTAQKLLYKCGPSWLDTARLLLRRAGRLGYDKQFFLLRTEEMDLNGLTSFYNSVLQAWQSASLRASLREAGCTKLGHLMKMTAISVDVLRARTNITSSRLIDRVVKKFVLPWDHLSELCEDPSRIFVAVGYGFFVEMNLDEALRFIDKKTSQLTAFTETLTKDSAKIKANIRMVLEGLRELQGLSDLPESSRRDLF